MGCPFFFFFFFLEKKIGFQKQFVLRKIKIARRTQFKAKIAKHRKKKNDTDEIGNVLLKHVFTTESIT